MNSADVITVVVCVFFGSGALSLAFAEPIAKVRARRRRVPITDSNRALRDRRANVVRNLDPAALAYALGPYDAELARLQHWVDRLAQNDPKRADR